MMKDKGNTTLSIHEVANMFGVNEWTIKFWVDKFDILQPLRNQAGDLIFSPVDVNRIEAICKLALKEKMKLKSVKEYLEAI